MSWVLAGVSAILVSISMPAANTVPPVPENKAAIPPLDRREAANYALQLFEVTKQISQQYVRPITQAELVAVGLQGIYEAAQVPVPPGLSVEVHMAAGSENRMLSLIANARVSVGNLDSLRAPRAIQASLRALTRILDPYSVVITGPEPQRLNQTAPNEFGFEWAESLGMGPLVVKSVIPGGPAQRAGLRPGDQITQVNGQALSGLPAAVPGAFPGRQVEFTALRPGTTGSRHFILRADAFHPETVLGVIRRPDNSWEYFLDPERKIAHVRLTTLEVQTAGDLEVALTRLQAARLSGLILDLRGCPGGGLEAAREVAHLFLPDYGLAYLVQPTPWNLVAQADMYLDKHCSNATVKYANGEEDKPTYHIRDTRFINFPLVVLVNGETTGGGELIAAVLQDNKRAMIAGQRTRGKGSVQRIWRLSGEGGGLLLKVPIPQTELRLTTGLLIRPSSRNLNRFSDSKPADDWGVRPDRGLDFPVSATLARQLREWWHLQDLRPGSSNESLPLDHPAADPQRQAALQLLIDVLK